MSPSIASDTHPVGSPCAVKDPSRLADIGVVDRRVLLCVICLWVVAAACGDSEDRSLPRSDASPTSLTNCLEVRQNRLPYSFCVPETWRVGDIMHMDGSIDIFMIDEAGEVFGSGKVSGPIEPSGRMTRFVPFPERLFGTKTRDRFLAHAGFEPNAVRDLSVETLSVDGRSGSLLRITIDIGDPQATSRVIDLRVPVGSGAGIDMLFVWDYTKADDDVIREVISTLRIDASMVEALLEPGSMTAASPG